MASNDDMPRLQEHAEKIYKTLDDFDGVVEDYSSYVFKTLKPRMTVKLNCDWHRAKDLKIGDTGVVEDMWDDGDEYWVKVQWGRAMRTVKVWCGWVDIVE